MSNFVSNLKATKGFSLIGILVLASAVVSVGLVIMDMTKQSRKYSTKLELDTDIELISDEISAILSDPVKCKATFTSAAPTDINGKYFIKTSPAAPSEGYGNSGLKIDSFILSEDTPPTPPYGILTINYQNKKFLKGNIGVANIAKTMGVYFLGSPGAVTECRASEASSEAEWSYVNGQNVILNSVINNIGMGMNSPKVKLDINGEVKVSKTGLLCNLDSEGSIRYNSTPTPTTPPTPKRMEFCNGIEWGPFKVIAAGPVPGPTAHCASNLIPACDSNHRTTDASGNQICGSPHSEFAASDKGSNKTGSFDVGMGQWDDILYDRAELDNCTLSVLGGRSICGRQFVRMKCGSNGKKWKYKLFRKRGR
jgi:hypothetical protein